MDRETLLAITDFLRTAFIAASFVLGLTFMARYSRRRWRQWEEGRHIMWMTATLTFAMAIFLTGRLWPDESEPPWFQPVCYVIAFGSLTFQLAWRHTLLPLTPLYAGRLARARQLLHRKAKVKP